MPRSLVVVLFARSDSIYFELARDVYNERRNALNYHGTLPVIAHPPCRAWSRLRHLARSDPGEKSLALFAVDEVRRCGGVLEHPAYSQLWPAANLPLPGKRDVWGGWTLPVVQRWWGHRAEKPTWLYIVGIEPRDIPPLPIAFGEATHVCGSNSWHDYKLSRKRPEIHKREREATPPAFAQWLLQLAASVQRQSSASCLASCSARP